MLDNVESVLKQLKTKEEITLEDVLRFFLELCKDINSDLNKPVYQLPVRDSKAAVNSLVSCGRIINNIGAEKQELFAVQKKDSLKKMMDRIEKQVEKFENVDISEESLSDKMNYHIQFEEMIGEVIDDLGKQQANNHLRMQELIIENLQI